MLTLLRTYLRHNRFSSFTKCTGSPISLRREENHKMGNSAAKATEPKVEGEKKLKPCCACPETKKIRDTCIIEKGEAECGHLIEAHKACMRHLGFNI